MGYEKAVMGVMPKFVRTNMPTGIKDVYRPPKPPKAMKEEAMPFKTVLISPRAGAIWKEYCGIFKRRWGLTEEACTQLGMYGKELASAEFVENGDSAYSTSVMQPIRNAYYNSGRMDHRWETLRNMRIEEPVLDYGCGVGFLLLWMNRIGYRRLYGHELEGVTKRVMLEAFKQHNIAVWTPGEHMATVLCINVLEHLKQPVDTLLYLKSIGQRVVANVCMDRHEHQHTAPEGELLRCVEILKEWGSYYES